MEIIRRVTKYDKELRSKAQYFNMRAICDKANISYNRYKNWSIGRTFLDDEEIKDILKVMKEVAR